ncbi:hypothetical protein Stok01_02993 [Sulfurisphaera tokodaii]
MLNVPWQFLNSGGLYHVGGVFVLISGIAPSPLSARSSIVFLFSFPGDVACDPPWYTISWSGDQYGEIPPM